MISKHLTGRKRKHCEMENKEILFIILQLRGLGNLYLRLCETERGLNHSCVAIHTSVLFFKMLAGSLSALALIHTQFLLCRIRNFSNSVCVFIIYILLLQILLKYIQPIYITIYMYTHTFKLHKNLRISSKISMMTNLIVSF